MRVIQKLLTKLQGCSAPYCHQQEVAFVWGTEVCSMYQPVSVSVWSVLSVVYWCEALGFTWHHLKTCSVSMNNLASSKSSSHKGKMHVIVTKHCKKFCHSVPWQHGCMPFPTPILTLYSVTELCCLQDFCNLLWHWCAFYPRRTLILMECCLHLLDMFSVQFHVTPNALYHHISINTDPALMKTGWHMQH
jgi:hypothetical protein